MHPLQRTTVGRSEGLVVQYLWWWTGNLKRDVLTNDCAVSLIETQTILDGAQGPPTKSQQWRAYSKSLFKAMKSTARKFFMIKRNPSESHIHNKITLIAMMLLTLLWR